MELAKLPPFDINLYAHYSQYCANAMLLRHNDLTHITTTQENFILNFVLRYDQIYDLVLCLVT
jgi:hypothetical protein